MMAIRGADMVFCLNTELLAQWKSWEKQAEMGTGERMSVCMGNPPVFYIPETRLVGGHASRYPPFHLLTFGTPEKHGKVSK